MDATQIAEESVLRDRLESELELLVAYQNKIYMHTEGLHQRERKELDDRVTLRREQLIQRVSCYLEVFFGCLRCRSLEVVALIGSARNLHLYLS